MGETIDGKAVAAAVRGEVRARVGRLAERGVTVGLATVLVGDDPASQVYVGNKQKACAEVGIRSFGHRLPATTTQAELLVLVRELAANPDVHIVVSHDVKQLSDYEAAGKIGKGFSTNAGK